LKIGPLSSSVVQFTFTSTFNDIKLLNL